MIRHFFYFILIVPFCLFADFSKKDAKKFTEKVWVSFKNQDIKWLKKHTSSSFQFVQAGQQVNKCGLLDIVSHLTIFCYQLSSFSITKQGDVFILSYVADANERSNGVSFSRNGNRLTILKEIDGHLMLVGQSDLSPTTPPGPCV